MVRCFFKLLLWMQLQQQWLSEVSSVNDISQFHHHIQFPRCRIGYIKGNSSANHNRQTLSSCQARGYQDRPNIHHILQEFEARRSFFSAALVTLFSSLTAETDITNLIFLGDSVSSQLFHFLFCDYYHSKLFKISEIQWVNQSCQFCVSYVDISIPSSSPKLLRLYNRQFNLPCLHDSHGNHEKCDDRRESEELSATFIRRLVSPLLSVSTSSSSSSPLSQQTVILLNYGLHVLTPKIADWSLRGMIRGVVQMSAPRATRQRNVSFFYRETSSQVFASARDGSYTPSSGTQLPEATQNHSRPFCCQYPRDLSRESNWRNHLVRQYLEESDPQWSKALGWIPFYNFSLELFDLRAESHKPNVVDCTHFIYLPMAYLSLWEEIRSGYLNFMKQP